jgi:hypothetical protein
VKYAFRTTNSTPSSGRSLLHLTINLTLPFHAGMLSNRTNDDTDATFAHTHFPAVYMTSEQATKRPNARAYRDLFAEIIADGAACRGAQLESRRAAMG